MSFTALDNLLWAAGFLLNAVLLCVLLLRRRYRTLPWFTAWIGFGSLFTILLFVANRLGLHRAYVVTYWSGALVDLAFQVAVVVEIGRIVLRRSGRWVEGAKGRFVAMALGGATLAAALTFAVKPLADGALSLWTMRGNLFTALLICFLFTAVVAASQQLGLGWRNFVMREGYGLTVWALTGFVVETMHGYFGSQRYFKTLDHIEMAVYLGSLTYWIVAFWLPEAAPEVIPPAQRKQYSALQKELQFRTPGGDSVR